VSASNPALPDTTTATIWNRRRSDAPVSLRGVSFLSQSRISFPASDCRSVGCEACGQIDFLLTSDSNRSQTLTGTGFADRMSWRILKPVTKDSRRSENSRALAADEGRSCEGLGDTGGQFKNHLIRGHAPDGDRPPLTLLSSLAFG
jgi:hypothetical protein